MQNFGVLMNVNDQPQLKPHLLQFIKDILGCLNLLNGYGSIPINTIFSGMNIHLPAILRFTRYQGFDTSPNIDPPHLWMHFWLSPLQLLPLGQWLSNCWRPRAMPKERRWIRTGTSTANAVLIDPEDIHIMSIYVYICILYYIYMYIYIYIYYII